MRTLGTLLRHHARNRPDRLAVVFEDTRLTFGQFAARVNRVSNMLLQLGLQKGDKVATLLPNCLEQLDVYWAAAQTGVVVVPLSPMLRRAGLSRLLDDSDAVLTITDRSFSSHLDEVRATLTKLAPDRYLVTDGPAEGYRDYQHLLNAASPADPPPIELHGDDDYNIIYSSGTTGLPKGIVHTHGIRLGYASGYADTLHFSADSIAAHAGSLVFNGAFLTLMPAMYVGVPFIVQREFDPVGLIDLIQTERITHMWLVPSQIIALLAAPNFAANKLASIDMLGSVGAPLLMEHKRAIANAIPGRFYELYGLTEGFTTVLDGRDFKQKPESVGRPTPSSKMRIERPDGHQCDPHEIGEIVGRGPLTMPGYYKRPDLTAEVLRDGWLHTGDLGYVDEDGFLYLVDREKDLIISGGVNVYPRDIEEIIAKHSAVREVAVFGVPDKKWGETPLAMVILREPETVSEAELCAWTNHRVEARYQKLSAVIFCDDFPRNVAGKTLKRVMRAPFWESNRVRS